ncbi:MAG: nucleotide exchange factor GrpE [Chloroflexi bacterium]|nr:nucleotide exchange factor GrpE [Chloroflexota bacterium]
MDEVKTVGDLEDELNDMETMKKALEDEKARADSCLANWQRAQADFINLKRRSEQQQAEAAKFANAALILGLLPAIDDFERGLAHMPPDLGDPAWAEGITMVYRKFKAALEAQGLTAIKSVGEDFDPNVHEAVMTVDGEEGKVIEEIQKGYKLYDRVIRPSLVKVGRGT